jgi:predicted kinase
LERHREALDQRRIRGRAVDGHGDLQLAHVWFSGSQLEPAIIDCTEFNAEFRRIDAGSEVAFLAMDLSYRGKSRLGERFLARYARETDDFDLYHVVDYFAAYRASVRAKVAVLASLDVELPAAQREAAQRSASSHLNLAERFLTGARHGSITIMCGSVGCGKSSVAGELSELLCGVVLSSDRTRKHLTGMRHDDHSAGHEETGTGLYSQARKDAVYAALLERAEAAVDSGRDVLLDASFARSELRDSVRSWAHARGIPARLVHVTCHAVVALERLAERERSGHDPSDAGPELLQWSLDHFESPEEWPSHERITIATDDPAWRTRISQASDPLRFLPAMS